MENLNEKTVNEILRETLAEMPETFATNHFIKVAKLKKYPYDYGWNGKQLNQFIKDNCSQITRRTFKKKISDPILFEDQTREAEAIQFLKEKGYKVMRPVNDYVEV